MKKFIKLLIKFFFLLILGLLIFSLNRSIKISKSIEKFETVKSRQDFFDKNKKYFYQIVRIFKNDSRIIEIRKINNFIDKGLCENSEIDFKYNIDNKYCLSSAKTISDVKQKKLTEKEMKKIKEVMYESKNFINMEHIYKIDQEKIIRFTLFSTLSEGIGYDYCYEKEYCYGYENDKFEYDDQIYMTNAVDKEWYSSIILNDY